ncbi:MAG: hypothetical protein RBS85_03495 [Methanofastidiosum sp.]|nr:hypothetical protein [Methanofastidiosum sp.]
MSEDIISLDREKRYIINIESVGQLMGRYTRQSMLSLARTTMPLNLDLWDMT